MPAVEGSSIPAAMETASVSAAMETASVSAAAMMLGQAKRGGQQ
jgi:hypothetical protein